MEKKYSNLYVLILAFTSSFGCHLSYVLSDEWKLSRQQSNLDYTFCLFRMQSKTFLQKGRQYLLCRNVESSSFEEIYKVSPLQKCRVAPLQTCRKKPLCRKDRRNVESISFAEMQRVAPLQNCIKKLLCRKANILFSDFNLQRRRMRGTEGQEKKVKLPHCYSQ